MEVAQKLQAEADAEATVAALAGEAAEPVPEQKPITSFIKKELAD